MPDARPLNWRRGCADLLAVAGCEDVPAEVDAIAGAG